MLLLAAIPGWFTAILVMLFFVVCLLLILAVLVQRPSGGGLSGAFGSGSGSGQTAFGAKTGDALTIATIAIFTVYLLFAIGLNYATRPTPELNVIPTASGDGAPVDGAAGQQPAPLDTPAPTPGYVPTPLPETPPAPADTTGPADPAPGQADPTGGEPASVPSPPSPPDPSPADPSKP